MNLPTLSVVVPNYNHGEYIAEQLEAILAQSLQPTEIIVIDDCSTDNSVEIIQSFVAQDNLVRLVCNEENWGVNYSVNKAIEMASGEYVCCCPADDRVLPGFFEQSMVLLAQYPEAGLCCSHPGFLDDATGAIDKKEDWFHLDDYSRYVSPEEVMNAVGPKGLWIAGFTCVFKRSAFIESGKYIPELKWYSDWFVWHIIAFRYGICYIPEVLAAIRVLPTSYSSVGRQDERAENEVIQHLVKLLRSEKYRDVAPAFRDSKLLEKFSFAPVLRRLLTLNS